MAANDDVLDLQNVHGILNNRKTVEIGVNHEIGDIAVNKQFAGFKAGQALRRYAAVGTSNPEKAWVLSLREFSKKSGVFLHQHF